MMDEHTESLREVEASQNSRLALIDGKVTLAYHQLDHLTLRQIRAILQDASAETQLTLVNYFSGLTELANTDARQALAHLARQVRDAPRRKLTSEWDHLIASIKRERNVASAITDETTLKRVAELLWEAHVRQ